MFSFLSSLFLSFQIFHFELKISYRTRVIRSYVCCRKIRIQFVKIYWIWIFYAPVQCIYNYTYMIYGIFVFLFLYTAESLNTSMTWPFTLAFYSINWILFCLAILMIRRLDSISFGGGGANFFYWARIPEPVHK